MTCLSLSIISNRATTNVIMMIAILESITSVVHPDSYSIHRPMRHAESDANDLNNPGHWFTINSGVYSKIL